MEIENKDVWVLVFDLEGRERIFKAYANDTAKTGRRAKKHAALKTKQYGTRFRAKIMTLEGEQHDGKEGTNDNISNEESGQGNGAGLSGSGDSGPATGAGDAGGGLLRGTGAGRSGDQTDIERIEALKRPPLTEENYKAGLFDKAAEPILETVGANFGNAERDELARQLGVIVDDDPILFTESQFREFQERGGLDADRQAGNPSAVFIRANADGDTGGEIDGDPKKL